MTGIHPQTGPTARRRTKTRVNAFYDKHTAEDQANRAKSSATGEGLLYKGYQKMKLKNEAKDLSSKSTTRSPKVTLEPHKGCSALSSPFLLYLCLAPKVENTHAKVPVTKACLHDE